MLPAGFEPTIPVNERPQTHALERAATGIRRDASMSEYSKKIALVLLELSTRSCQQARQTGSITPQSMYIQHSTK
jgi:hypothetical protein